MSIAAHTHLFQICHPQHGAADRTNGDCTCGSKSLHYGHACWYSHVELLALVVARGLEEHHLHWGTGASVQGGARLPYQRARTCHIREARTCHIKEVCACHIKEVCACHIREVRACHIVPYQGSRHMLAISRRCTLAISGCMCLSTYGTSLSLLYKD